MYSPPWKMKPLDEWQIVVMTHYTVNGQRRLFVAMDKDGRFIKEEGADDESLWGRLHYKAGASPQGESAKAQG